MSKEEARNILENYLNKGTGANDLKIGLPIWDEVIRSEMSFDKQQTVCENYTFRYLLMIAYDLKDNKEDGKD